VVIIVLMMAAILYFTWDKFLVLPTIEQSRPTTARTAPAETSDNSIAVLPFLNIKR
jgi:hypothetical protein